MSTSRSTSSSAAPLASNLRIHPAIGIARVGNSEEYYLGPESMAGLPIPGSPLTGGLPIKPGTEDTPIDSADLRDGMGRLKRQAARFRIYQYALPALPSSSGSAAAETYPNGGGSEVFIGSMVDGKKVADIIWTVHLANKKANAWNTEGVGEFENGQLPALRNPGFMHSNDPASPKRLQHLVIDPGPRAISVIDANSASPASIKSSFRQGSIANYYDMAAQAITALPDYPQSWPASVPAKAPPAYSRAITALGALAAEAKGRLLVLGGYGLACGFDANGEYSDKAALNGDVNNNFWLDDTADGPVSAVLVFEDHSVRAVDSNAWVIATDPAYAPQTTNVVTLWDDMYTTWLEQFALQPAIYTGGDYQASYKPCFAQDVKPVLNAAAMQKWNVNLPWNAIAAHDKLGAMTADGLDFMIMNFIRDPNDDGAHAIGTPSMPLSLGDVGKSFLSVTRSQHFFLQQWANGDYSGVQPPLLGPGETLDKTILFNCLGGRFSPGIEMTFIVRDPKLYRQNWQHAGSGPFRINQQMLDYASARPDQPFLGEGYVPLRDAPVQPGDVSKFMAIPWHTDYNSCATHPTGDSTDPLLYASWPAQRPVAVYTYEDVKANDGLLPRPRFSVRGEGTASPDAPQVGRYQNRIDFLLNWSRIGVVMQAPAIVGYPAQISDDNGNLHFDPAFYLEVGSQFGHDESNLSEYWRNTRIDRLYAPPPKKGTAD